MKEANEDFEQETSTVPFKNSRQDNFNSLNTAENGQNLVRLPYRAESGSSSKTTKVDDNRTMSDNVRTESKSNKTEAGGTYYEPSEFVCLASVARRRSVYINNRVVESDDDIEILDDLPVKKGVRKSVLSKSENSSTRSKDKKVKNDVKGAKRSKKNKSTLKSNSNANSHVEKAGEKEGTIEGKTSKKGTKQSVNNSKKIKGVSKTLSDHNSDTDVVDSVPKQRSKRKSSHQNEVDPYDICSEESDINNNTDNEELYVAKAKTGGNKHSEKKKAKKEKSHMRKTVSAVRVRPNQRLKRKSVIENKTDIAVTCDVSDEDNTNSKELPVEETESDTYKDIMHVDKKARKEKSNTKQTANKVKVMPKQRLKRKSTMEDKVDPHGNYDDDAGEDITDKEELYIEENETDNYKDIHADNKSARNKKYNMKQTFNSVAKLDDSEKNFRTAKSAKNQIKSKKRTEQKAKTVEKTAFERPIEISTRKTLSQKNVRSQSLSRNSKLKSLNTISSLRSNKRKVVNEKQTLENNDSYDNSVSKTNKSPKSDSAPHNKTEQNSTKRKLEFNKKVKTSRRSSKKIDNGSSKSREIPCDDLGSVFNSRHEVTNNQSISTPIAASLLTGKNFSLFSSS